MDGESADTEVFEMTVEEQVAEKLDEKEEEVATAESATGGLVGSLLTDVAGASTYFDRSVVVYSNRAKQELAGVNREALYEESAVSEEVALQMARGVRDLSQTEWGVSVTGYAGPESDDKPAGTVFIGVAYAGDSQKRPYAKVERYNFDGPREEVKEKFAKQALEDLLVEINSEE